MENKFTSKLPIGAIYVEWGQPHRIFMTTSSSIDMSVGDLICKPGPGESGLLYQRCLNHKQLIQDCVPLNFIVRRELVDDYDYGKPVFGSLTPFTQKSFDLLVKQQFNFRMFFNHHSTFALNAYDVAGSTAPKPDHDDVEVIRFNDAGNDAKKWSVTVRYKVDHRSGYKKNLFRALLGKLILSEQFNRNREYVYLEINLDVFMQHYYITDK